MENSIVNSISVWKNQGAPHDMALKIVQACIDSGYLKPVFKTIVQYDSPFSRQKIEDAFEKISKFIEPKKRLYLPKYDQVSREIHPTLDQIKICYEQISQLRGKLFEIHYTKVGNQRRSFNKKAARDTAFEINNLSAILRESLDDLDYYQEHGKRKPSKSIPMDPLQRAAYLLDNQVEAKNYVRKAETYRRKNGNLQNPEAYRERKELLKEIDEFKEKYAR